MSVTVDCGDGRHDLCTRVALKTSYDGERGERWGDRFVCACPCHRRQDIYLACGELSELGVPPDVLAPIREYADSLVAGGTRP